MVSRRRLLAYVVVLIIALFLTVGVVAVNAPNRVSDYGGSEPVNRLSDGVGAQETKAAYPPE